jgi:hypothetical protein
MGEPNTDAKTPVRCQWYDDTYDDATSPGPMPETCDADAKWISCVPNTITLTCDAHKCRCARPISDAVHAPPAEVFSRDKWRREQYERAAACIVAFIFAAEERGRAAERAAVVAWLRERIAGVSCPRAATRIEDGEHVKESDHG